MHLLVSNGATLLIRRRVDELSAEASPHVRLVAHLVGTIYSQLTQWRKRGIWAKIWSGLDTPTYHYAELIRQYLYKLSVDP